MRNNKALLKFELMNAAADSNYYVHSRIEIASILRDIMQKNTLISVYFDEGNSFIVTAILEVNEDDGTLILDCGPDPKTNARLPQAQRLVCITSVDKVKIQFVCADAELVKYEGRDVFCMPMPEKLLRLQRREYFRLTTPVANPLKCVLTAHSEGEPRQLELNIADISCGGIATTSSTSMPLFEPATKFECRLALSDTDLLEVTVELRNTFEVTLANGRKLRRCGYQFIGLQEKDRVQVQRYIMQQQRSQRSRASSFA